MNDDIFRYAAHHYAKFVLMVNGFNVLEPSPHLPYDLMINVGTDWKKVQIKTSTMVGHSGNYEFGLRRSRSNVSGQTFRLYTAEECDYFLLIAKNLVCWLIPFDKLKHIKSTVTPESKYSAFKL